MTYPFLRRDWLVVAIGALAVAIATTVFLITESGRWLGVWTETGQALRGSTLLSGPLVLAVGAFLGAAEDRNGLRVVALSAPVSAWRRTRVPVLATAGLALLGMAVPAAVALVRTGSRASYDGPVLPLLLLGAAGLVAFAVVGVGLGVLVRWPLLPVALTVAAYFVIAYVSSSSLFLLVPFDERSVTEVRLGGEVLAASLLWFLGLAVAVWGLACRGRVAACVAAAVAVGAAVVLAGQPGFPYDEDRGASALRCASSPQAGASVEICLLAVHDFPRADVTEAVLAVRAPLAGTPFAPTRFVETSETGPPQPVGGGLGFVTAGDGLSGGATVDRAPMLDQLSFLLLDPVACAPDADGLYRAKATDVIRAWLATSVGLTASAPLDPTDLAAVQRFDTAVVRFAELPDEQRRAFLTARETSIRDCTLADADLP